MKNIFFGGFKKHFWLIVILAFGTILRFYNNTQISLWHDEAFSALLIKYPWGEMLQRIGLDVHPPMYYVFLRFWHYIFGDSLLALRSFSILFGVGTIWAVWLFTKTIFHSEKIALWSALLITLNPFQLKYVTEARMYTMGAFFVVLAGYFLVKALSEQKEFFKDQNAHMPNLPKDISLHRHYVWHYFAFAICSGIMILTHYYLLFTVFALCFYGLLFHIAHYKTQIKKYFELFLSYLVIIFCFLPWLKIFLFQYRQVQGGYWIEKMNVWSIPATLWEMFLGIGIDISKPATQNGLILVSLFCIFVFYRFVRKTGEWAKWLILFAFLAPFLGSFLFVTLAKLKGSNSSVYLVRYFLFTSSFFSIALAVWLAKIRLKFISTILFTIYCLVNIFTFWAYWKDLNINSRVGMSGVAKYLEANMELGHKLYSGSSFMFFNLKYYISQINSGRTALFWLMANDSQKNFPVRNYQTPLLFSGGITQIEKMPHYAGTAILRNEDLLPDLSRDVKQRDTIWLVWTEAFGSSKPQIPKNWNQISEKIFLEVRPYPWAQIFVTEYKVN
jgi:uncharacterized membrane protein